MYMFQLNRSPVINDDEQHHTSPHLLDRFLFWAGAGSDHSFGEAVL
jgi:hypothetical protein